MSSPSATAPAADGAVGARVDASTRGQWVEHVDRVLAVLRQELSTLIATSSPTTKALSTLLCVGYIVYFTNPWTANIFALVPERTLPCVWNVMTSGYYEMSLFGAVIDVLGLMYLGRQVEPIWGAPEFVHYIIVVNAACGICTFITMYVLYIITRSQFYLFAKFSGFHGILAALMIALRQLLPDEHVPLPGPLGALRLRNKHLFGTYIIGCAFLCILSGAEHHHIGLYLFVIYGSYTGWVYLRYFQVHGDRKGDNSEDFGFAELFPSPLRPVIRRLTDPCHTVFCTPPTGNATQQGRRRRPGGVSAAHGAPAADVEAPRLTDMTGDGGGAEGTQGGDTDKRRERAARGARLLEERMARLGGGGDDDKAGTPTAEKSGE